MGLLDKLFSTGRKRRNVSMDTSAENQNSTPMISTLPSTQGTDDEAVVCNQFTKREISDLLSTYDMDTIDGIRAIPVPRADKDDLSMDYQDRIEYILQRKATEHRKAGNMDLAIECLKKSNEIMPNTYFCYPKKEYLRLVNYLKMANRDDEANAELKKIESMFGAGDIRKADRIRLFHETLDSAKCLGLDLLEMSYHSDCCPECAKYQGRVFSISGKDTRFPKLPAQIFETGELHEGCRHRFYPYCYYPGAQLCINIMDESEKGYHIEYVDAVEFSNRPFVDDRSEYEKEYYRFRVMCKEYESTSSKAAQLYSARDFKNAEHVYIDATVLFNMLLPMWMKFDQRLPYGDTPFKRLAMIREKSGDYEGAALACVQQLRLGVEGDGTKGGMRGRLARMVKKGSLDITSPEAMTEISKYLEI